MDWHWLKRHTQRRPAQCQVAGHAHVVFLLGVVCVKFNREGVATVGKGARRLCTNARQARSYQPLQVQEILKRGEKSIAESQGAFKSMHRQKRHGGQSLRNARV